MMQRPAPIATALLLTATLAACTGDRLSFDGGGGGAAAPARPAAPPVNMAGRWTLQSQGRACSMTFGGAGGAAEGTIAPAGGCPGQFYTSRKWQFDSNGLSVLNHNSEPLAQLSAAQDGHFQGQSTGGDAVTLTR